MKCTKYKWEKRLLTLYSLGLFSSIFVVNIIGTKDGSVTLSFASNLNISDLGNDKSNVAMTSLPANTIKM